MLADGGSSSSCSGCRRPEMNTHSTRLQSLLPQSLRFGRRLSNLHRNSFLKAMLLLSLLLHSWAYVFGLSCGNLTSFVGLNHRRTLTPRSLNVRLAAPSTEAASATSSTSAEPSLLAVPLKLASSLMNVLKPFFSWQAQLQAGSYDRSKLRSLLEAEVKSAPVVIYTYSSSPFSIEAKNLLASLGADYKEISLGAEWFVASPESAAKRAELGSMYGRTSLPQIFIGGRDIGGLVEGTPGLLPLSESGELLPALQQAGALPDDGLFGFFLYSGEHREAQLKKTG
eukprot:TRINITY_DN116933_c0_g1_i1.p1 TRINITY_DN116933_c0_g1~~TRINITY_DN116933_c0_g1_i1.p1  ORF type:complete len:283 (+),score=41.84 TRINITY_DN116933_c0_g1_i1:93-941(+)